MEYLPSGLTAAHRSTREGVPDGPFGIPASTGMARAPVPVPCSPPSSRDAYCLSSISLFLSSSLLPHSRSLSPSPLPSLYPCPGGGCLYPAAFSLSPAASPPPPPLTFSHPRAISATAPASWRGKTVPASPPPGVPRQGHPQSFRPTPASEEVPRQSLGVGVPFLSIQRRFPGPPAPVNTYRGFPVRRRMLSWAAGCSGAGGGDSTWGWGRRVTSSGTPCRGFPHDPSAFFG